MGRLALAVLLALGAPAAATPEYVLPTLFDVVDVAPEDVLNVRAAPDAAAEVVGRLAPGARGVEVMALDATGRWGQVNAGERAGWASMRFLAYRSDVWEPGQVPETLRCLGTEPFWSLRPEAGTLVLEEPGAEALRLGLGAVLDTGRFRDPLRVLIGEGGSERVTATILPRVCSDGMSDRAYGLEAVVVHEQDGAAKLLGGCCSIAP